MAGSQLLYFVAFLVTIATLIILVFLAVLVVRAIHVDYLVALLFALLNLISLVTLVARGFLPTFVVPLVKLLSLPSILLINFRDYFDLQFWFLN